MIFLFLALIIPVFSAGAVEREGVTFSETQELGSTQLHLNGVGLRYKKILVAKIKVYVAGLYLTAPSHDPHAILESQAPKMVLMHFLRGVGREKLVDAWKESYQINCKNECGVHQGALQKMTDFMADTSDGTEISIRILPESILISISGGAPALPLRELKLENKGFGKILLATWLGSEPPNESLKEELLGNAQH